MTSNELMCGKPHIIEAIVIADLAAQLVWVEARQPGKRLDGAASALRAVLPTSRLPRPGYLICLHKMHCGRLPHKMPSLTNAVSLGSVKGRVQNDLYMQMDQTTISDSTRCAKPLTPSMLHARSQGEGAHKPALSTRCQITPHHLQLSC